MEAEATVEEAAQQAASPVGSEATVGESMAALFQGLRARNEELLQTARAHQAHLLEAWERICQRPRGAAGRDETQRVPRSSGTWAHAADPAAAPGAPDAFQPGMEFLQATLPQQKHACSATEQERAAALFKELQIQNETFLAELRATCKAPLCAQGGRLASSSGDHYESPRDKHATSGTLGELVKGSWV